MAWERGTVEKVDYTFGGAGNQWVTINGTRYATFFDWNTSNIQEGTTVEFWPHMRSLWSNAPAVPHAAIRNAAEPTNEILTVEAHAYKALPWWAFYNAKDRPQALKDRAMSIVAEHFAEIAAAKRRHEANTQTLSSRMSSHSAYLRAFRPLWVLYDTEADEGDSFMLIGLDPQELAKEAASHLELETA